MASYIPVKLSESIPSNGVKIIELYNKIDNGLLNTQPNYQRKLVWKKQHKFAFIETILLNFPFPEVYIASKDIDVDKMVANEVVVDGQQRLTTIVDYIKGEGDFAKQNKVKSFSELTSIEKKEFLNYKVTVKDLKDLGEPLIKEIFQRINSTEYSLNIVERNNAIYGAGEIALFCKQLTDAAYVATEKETDIILDPKVKEEINSFFTDRSIFTQNDIKRMYDFQYVMLITSTILEGAYFSRSTKVDEYLERFNSFFSGDKIVTEALLKATRIISKLGFSNKSYWYNKANIFTLIVELSQFETDRLNITKLEVELLELEDKVDQYFSAETEEELKNISEDEKRYFEAARHGSHEKPNRDHRGKVIQDILKKSTLEIVPSGSLETTNIELLNNKEIEFAVITPTETGLSKSIMDAITDVRIFFKNKNLHDYSNQDFGPDNKVKLECVLLYDNKVTQSELSLYRSNGRGDYRIWIKDLNEFAKAQQKLAFIMREEKITILNLTSINYTNNL